MDWRRVSYDDALGLLTESHQEHCMPANPRRDIPSVDKVLEAVGGQDVPRPMVVQLVREKLKAIRKTGEIPDFDTLVASINDALESLARTRIQPVINGSGVLIHTNLGRAPLSELTVDYLGALACQYSNLEYNLDTGKRGKRAEYLELALSLVCDCEAATVVNNGAAALLLILESFCSEKKSEVVISRGELIQIGGGFRIPEILEASGAKLVEIGTTNRTSLKDYEKAIGSDTALILKVHRSNFFMEGFVKSPGTQEIAALSRKKRIPFVEDLGSGAIEATESRAEVEHEPTPAEILKQGVQLVCFSGDKLLGGPQAGIIAGRKRWISAMKREPLFRAMRCDKLVLSALQCTIDTHLRSLEGVEGARPLPYTPVMDMLSTTPVELRLRARKIMADLQGASLVVTTSSSESRIGGGALPKSAIPSVTLDLVPVRVSVKELAARLRQAEAPVVGYIAGQKVRIDLRTVFPFQDEALVSSILEAAGRRGNE
jgi:L-seryl-tRNA(Ser) seleniumtransferase